MSKIVITAENAEQIKELQSLLKSNPHLKVLYFTRDGNYYVNSYKYTAEGSEEEKEYVRIGLIHTAGSKPEAVLDQYEVVGKLTREDILSAAPAEPVKETEPAKAPEQKPAEVKTAPAKALAAAPIPEPIKAAPESAEPETKA